MTQTATMQSTAKLTRDQYLDLYYFMQLNRQLEDRMVRLFRQNKIVGGVYSSLGQEAVSVGTAYALEPRDWLAPMIRNIGALLVKGFKPRDIFTQHMAKYTSPTKGKDGTSHFGDLKTRHVVSPISMLGDLIPVMTGVAMAGRYLGQNIVAMTWIGDGGSSTGAFHEGLNLAASQRAPFVLIVENNQWAYSTPVARQVPLKNLADRAAAYGIASHKRGWQRRDRRLRRRERSGRTVPRRPRPVLIEVKTMRMKGHAQHDAAEYVPKEMVEYWKTQIRSRATRSISPSIIFGIRRKNLKSMRASNANWTKIRSSPRNRRCRRPNSPSRAFIAKAATRSKPNGSAPRKK